MFLDCSNAFSICVPRVLNGFSNVLAVKSSSSLHGNQANKDVHLMFAELDAKFE
jgi:hypothetical protein